ncbi:MAG: YggT family protein [Betaproteobacteria bacterium]|nr:YggT family protein [Betaproteobacteria bacterium]
MVSQALIFLVATLGGLFALALLLRFMLQLLRAPARNQLSEFVAALTDFAVRPARRVIPGWWGIDLATLALAWLTEVMQIWLVLKIKGYELGSAVGIALVALSALAAVQIAKLALYVVMVAVVMQAVLSWINPYNPLAPLLTSVTRPFLRPFQKFIPLVANVDLSPLAVLLVCQLLLTVPLAWLEAAISRLL